MKANADKLNVGHAGVGSVFFNSAVLLHAILEVKPTLVPFTGGLPAMNALVAGQVDYICARRHHRHAAARGWQDQGLCDRVAQAEPCPAEHSDHDRRPGCPEFQTSAWFALFAPRGTPQPILDRFTRRARPGARR